MSHHLSKLFGSSSCYKWGRKKKPPPQASLGGRVIHKKHNIDIQDILFDFEIQYLEQFAEYKRKKIKKEIYTFRFNEKEGERLLLFTNKIEGSYLYELLKNKKYTDDYIKNLQNALNIINREIKEENKGYEELKKLLFGDSLEEDRLV